MKRSLTFVIIVLKISSRKMT